MASLSRSAIEQQADFKDSSSWMAIRSSWQFGLRSWFVNVTSVYIFACLPYVIRKLARCFHCSSPPRVSSITTISATQTSSPPSSTILPLLSPPYSPPSPNTHKSPLLTTSFLSPTTLTKHHNHAPQPRAPIPPTTGHHPGSNCGSNRHQRRRRLHLSPFAAASDFVWRAGTGAWHLQPERGFVSGKYDACGGDDGVECVSEGVSIGNLGLRMPWECSVV